METFFHYFEEKTGYPPPVAQQAIQVISRYLAKNYREEFAFFIQYFLTLNFDNIDKGKDASPERHAENQNL